MGDGPRAIPQHDGEASKEASPLRGSKSFVIGGLKPTNLEALRAAQCSSNIVHDKGLRPFIWTMFEGHCVSMVFKMAILLPF